MSQILSAEMPIEEKPPFWIRQFSPERTRAQVTFDFVFGILLPVLTLIADPIVFKEGIFGEEPVLGDYQIFAYLVSGLELVVLFVWLTLGRHLTSFSAPIGGVFLAGGLFSLVVGFLILPYTLIGLIFLIGAAGFTPFVTAFVYFRNGVRALKTQERNDTFGARFVLAAAMVLLSIGCPLLISFQLTDAVAVAVHDLIYGDSVASEQAVNRLKWLPLPEVERRRIVTAYSREENAEKKSVLKRYYADLTGEDIDFKLRIMDD